LESLEEFAFGLLHTLRGFGVAAGCGDASQDGQSETRTQVSLRLGQREQRLQRSLVAAVNPLLAALFVDFDIGLRAWTMIVEIGIEVGAVEPLQALGMGCVNRALAQMLADYSAIFGFDQAVVVALPRSAFGLFDQ
jgi:hypothetical protein